MSAIQMDQREILDRLGNMPPEEFDALLEKALARRAQQTVTRLSHDETLLVERINRGLSLETRKRLKRLTTLRNKGTISAAEMEELRQLTQEAENQDADRAGALLLLAKTQNVPVRVLMRQMGIKAPLVHG